MIIVMGKGLYNYWDEDGGDVDVDVVVMLYVFS